MQPSLKDQLANIKIDPNTYGRLPIREDVLAFNGNEKGLLKQWEKLNYIRKNLKIIDRYLNSGTGKKLGEWLNDNSQSVSPEVVNKIGGFNDSTGGISSYFLNLQNYYDEQEQVYDNLELGSKAPDEISTIISEMRNERSEKRKNRREIRKIKTKDLRKDGKGYLYVDVPEPKEVAKSEVAAAVENAPISEKQKAVVVEKTEKVKKEIKVFIAGAVITVFAIGVVVSLASSTTSE